MSSHHPLIILSLSSPSSSHHPLDTSTTIVVCLCATPWFVAAVEHTSPLHSSPHVTSPLLFPRPSATTGCRRASQTTHVAPPGLMASGTGRSRLVRPPHALLRCHSIIRRCTSPSLGVHRASTLQRRSWACANNRNHPISERRTRFHANTASELPSAPCA